MCQFAMIMAPWRFKTRKSYVDVGISFESRLWLITKLDFVVPRVAVVIRIGAVSRPSVASRCLDSRACHKMGVWVLPAVLSPLARVSKKKKKNKKGGGWKVSLKSSVWPAIELMFTRVTNPGLRQPRPGSHLLRCYQHLFDFSICHPLRTI